MTHLFGGGFFVFGLVYFAVVISLLWFTYRFVKAHEKIADGVHDIKHQLHQMNDKKSAAE